MTFQSVQRYVIGRERFCKIGNATITVVYDFSYAYSRINCTFSGIKFNVPERYCYFKSAAVKYIRNKN